ncbi:MAG: glycoside hydrolase family 25 protein [Eubacterium sp.]|nr:glycoside hydrolase family 25 protein [Eubacterium sp.]MBQ6361827.1 glycoside hydrolase family 25 protein [Lachnospiraceae bacterium]MBQ6364411.1 glycoside hydrolase family 25 protein [Lachnospiraceae bacterium]MBQ6635371.1 glycoside hydrolase family 25 protein [Lachnospiraceae bacterium]
MNRKLRNHMMKRLMAALLAAALLLLTVPGFGTRAEAAQKGIDVSQWQGAINWQAVKAGGADFAMIRIGNCKYGLDTRFAENMIGASAAGLRVGCYVYTYATNVQEAIADATLAVQAMAPFQVSFPVAIDMEDSVHKTLNPLQQAEIVNAFCSVIYQAGYSPMVYASRNWFLERMGPVPWDHWVAMYNTHCDYPGFTMWQSSCSGTIPGVAGKVDINYLFKDYASLIPANGFSNQAGMTFYFVNYRKQFGLQNIGGLQFLFQPNGDMVRNVTTTDEAGNITRYCKDGHIVVITAQMQQAAANAAAQLNAAQVAQAAAEAAAAQAGLQTGAAQTLTQQIAGAAAEMAAAAQTLTAQFNAAPTQELLAQLTLTQQQCEVLNAQLVQAQQAEVAAVQNQAALEQAMLQAQTQTALAEQVNAAAQAAIVIPD